MQSKICWATTNSRECHSNGKTVAPTPLTDEQRKQWLGKFFSEAAHSHWPVQLRKGDTLYRKGSPATEDHLILRGEIRLIEQNKTTEICGPDRWLFESAHELGHVYLQTAVALTETLLIAFRSATFYETLRRPDNEVLFTKFMTDTAYRVSAKNKSQDPAKKRLARELHTICDGREVLNLIASPTRLGAKIGASRKTVHELLTELSRTGIISKVSYKTYRLHRSALETFLQLRDDEE
jgi:CRP-like cAMP-binding protein